jgi:hypothetical protein
MKRYCLFVLAATAQSFFSLTPSIANEGSYAFCNERGQVAYTSEASQAVDRASYILFTERPYVHDWAKADTAEKGVDRSFISNPPPSSTNHVQADGHFNFRCQKR